MDGSQRRTVLGGRQLTGVAVGQYAVAILDQAQAVFADLATHPHVLVLNGDALPAQQLLDLRNRLVPVVEGDLLHPVQRPGEIHCRRPGGVQIFLGFMKLPIKTVEVLRLNLPGGQIQAEARSHADRGRATHLQEIDSLPNVLLFGQVQNLHLARQLRLIDNDQRVIFLIQRHGFVAHNVLICHEKRPFILYFADTKKRRPAAL